MLALEVLWQERSVDATLGRIDPVWARLFANYRGLLQADGEGYYDASDRILKID